MSTIGDKRGSVRGAPPCIYVPFGISDDDGEAFRPVLQFFGYILKGAICFIFLLFVLVVLYAIGDDNVIY